MTYLKSAQTNQSATGIDIDIFALFAGGSFTTDEFYLKVYYEGGIQSEFEIQESEDSLSISLPTEGGKSYEFKVLEDGIQLSSNTSPNPKITFNDSLKEIPSGETEKDIEFSIERKETGRRMLATGDTKIFEFSVKIFKCSWSDCTKCTYDATAKIGKCQTCESFFEIQDDGSCERNALGYTSLFLSYFTTSFLGLTIISGLICAILNKGVFLGASLISSIQLFYISTI